MLSAIKPYLHATIDLIFPRPCAGCEDPLLANEKHLCLLCAADMPLTLNEDLEENPIDQLFWGKLELHAASALWHFNKGNKVQNILHKVKYKNDRALARFIGQEMGKTLRKSSRFANIDMVIPVPLHKTKLKKRGFNQSELIANALASELEVPCHTNILERASITSTQTRKTRLQRWRNVNSVFRTSKEANLNGKHVLLVDDVITTGATLEGCVNSLIENHNPKISVYAAAVA